MRISELTRRDIIDSLLLKDYPFHGRLDLIAFLKRVWDLSSMPSTDGRFKTAEGDIWQHMINNYNWNDAYLLLEYLELLSCDDKTFCRFLEECLHPVVRSNEEQTKELLQEFNRFLAYDDFKIEETSKLSGRPLYSVLPIDQAVSVAQSKYEIVLSFAGEDREYVEAVAHYLKQNDVSVFYDKYEEVTLWGKDLTEHLDAVYRGSARYCVMFISNHYSDKIWTNQERRSALAKAVQEKQEYILPARFDDTELPGIRPTVGYVDLHDKSPQQIGEMIIAKLGRIKAS